MADFKADPQSAGEILGAFNHWDDIEVNIRGHKITSGGHGFCGIGRFRAGFWGSVAGRLKPGFCIGGRYCGIIDGRFMFGYLLV